jgi:hypothetical protein
MGKNARTADDQSASSTTAAAHDESSSSRKERAIKNDLLSSEVLRPLRILGIMSFLIVLLVGSVAAVAAGVAILQQQQQQQNDHHYEQQQSSHRRVIDIIRYSIGRHQHLRSLVTLFLNWDSKSREGGEVGGGAPVLAQATAAALVQSTAKNGNDGLASEAGVDKIAEATPVTSSGTYLLFVICIYVFLS